MREAYIPNLSHLGAYEFLAPELREITARLDAQGEQLRDLRGDVKQLALEMKQSLQRLDGRFEDLRADLRLSQRVEQIEKTLRQSSQQ